MDRFDAFAVVSVLAIAATGVLVSVQGPASSTTRRVGLAHHQQATAQPDLLDPRLERIRRLLESGSLQLAQGDLQQVIAARPRCADCQMLMGDITFRMQHPLQALPFYRAAVDLDPDFLDKNTARFQGRKLSRAVEEAATELQRQKAKKGPGAALKAQRKIVYYLQRRIAGSCG